MKKSLTKEEKLITALVLQRVSDHLELEDDGISGRLDGITFSKWRQESIKAYGNAWVPQVAF